MAFKIDRNTFIYLIAAMVILIAVMGGAAVFIHINGGVGDIFKNPLDPIDPIYPVDPKETEENGPWGQKNYLWEYEGVSHEISVFIPKDVYQRYRHGISGTYYPDNITDYIVTDDEGDVLRTVAGQFKTKIQGMNYLNDEDKVGFVLSFVKALSYKTDRESSHSDSYPRTPAVMLADGVGDSGDHAVLAAAILQELGYSVSLIRYPPMVDRLTVIPEAVTLGLIFSDAGSGPVYGVSLSDETFYISPFWTVDTEEKGTSVSAYGGITPEIYLGDTFWTGKAYAPADSLTLGIKDVLFIKDSNDLSYTPHDWQQNVTDYYSDEWYPSGVSWSLSDEWRLHELFFEVDDIPSSLYTPWGSAEYNATVPWRIVYKITDYDGDSVSGMTPYSDLKIALYEIDSVSGAAKLLDVFGWQGHYFATEEQVKGPFSPGRYAIGVFVRNAGAEISIEFHGKSDGVAESYEGGI